MREKKFQQEHERWQKWQEEREVELEMKEVEREKWEEQRVSQSTKHSGCLVKFLLIVMLISNPSRYCMAVVDMWL